jgi:signal transduction histidine kinase
MAALVVDVGNARRTGGARGMLAEALGDPTVELAYHRASAAGYASIDGSPASPREEPGRIATPVIREGQEIAVVIHDQRLLAEPGVVAETIAAARLAIENEQLQAELSAQATEIRASRWRIVRDGDRARRELERDLHDGAQQRLVSLSLAIRLLQTRAQTSATRDALESADARLREALAELRDVAHGIYPAGLRDEGLAAAFEDLAERSMGRITLLDLPEERFPATVEEAAYFAVAEILEDLDEHEGPASIAARAAKGRIEVAVHRDGPVAYPADRMTEISDRIGALDGAVDITESPTGALDLRASIPCV